LFLVKADFFLQLVEVGDFDLTGLDFGLDLGQFFLYLVDQVENLVQVALLCQVLNLVHTHVELA
jgi:hypothetical protein